MQSYYISYHNFPFWQTHYFSPENKIKKSIPFFFHKTARSPLLVYSWLLIFRSLISQIVPNCDLPEPYILFHQFHLACYKQYKQKFLSLYAKCHVEQIIFFIMQVSSRIKHKFFPRWGKKFCQLEYLTSKSYYMIWLHDVSDY